MLAGTSTQTANTNGYYDVYMYNFTTNKSVDFATGHTDPITAVKVLDGGVFACASDAGLLRTSSTTNGASVNDWTFVSQSTEYSVNCLELLTSGYMAYALSGSSNVLGVFNYNSGTIIASISTSSNINCIQYLNGNLLAGGLNATSNNLYVTYFHIL